MVSRRATLAWYSFESSYWPLPSRSQPGWVSEPSPWVRTRMAFSTIEPEVSMMMTKRGRTVSACAGPVATRLTSTASATARRDIRAFV
jgi:hypothetical protein